MPKLWKYDIANEKLDGIEASTSPFSHKLFKTLTFKFLFSLLKYLMNSYDLSFALIPIVYHVPSGSICGLAIVDRIVGR